MNKYYHVASVRLFALALLVLCPSWAQATVIYNFTGVFAPANWTASPDLGTVGFNNSTPPTTLTITGPTGDFSPSFDSISIVGPTMTGNPSGVWFLNFQWSLNTGASQGATVELDYTGLSSPIVLATGGAGYTASGTYEVPLDQGDTFSILMTSDSTGIGKGAPVFTLDDFSAVPEAQTTPWLEACLLLPICGRLAFKMYRRKVTSV